MRRRVAVRPIAGPATCIRTRCMSWRIQLVATEDACAHPGDWPAAASKHGLGRSAAYNPHRQREYQRACGQQHAKLRPLE